MVLPSQLGISLQGNNRDVRLRFQRFHLNLLKENFSCIYTRQNQITYPPRIIKLNPAKTHGKYIAFFKITIRLTRLFFGLIFNSYLKTSTKPKRYYLVFVILAPNVHYTQNHAIHKNLYKKTPLEHFKLKSK
jgi:hypothetical protein